MIKSIKPVAFALLLLATVFGACKKEYETIQAQDAKEIQAYISKNNLQVQQYNQTGLYYQILQPGTGADLENSDKVYMTFTLKTLDGSYNSTDENLNQYTSFVGYLDPAEKQFNFPKAFHIAVKDLLKKRGGSIRVIIPSNLAFGRTGSGKIPGNASLDCVIKVSTATNNADFEEQFVSKYIQSSNLTGFTRLPSGVYYKIATVGTGKSIANTESLVKVTYTGLLTNGTKFDSRDSKDPLSSPLNALIAGWQVGLPLIKEGGSIRLIIPPSQGYGAASTANIPANSVLDFDIQLLQVTNY